jgi:hypothetical protein
MIKGDQEGKIKGAQNAARVYHQNSEKCPDRSERIPFKTGS